MSYRIILILIRSLGLLPLSVLRALGGIIGLSVFYFSKRAGKRTKQNLTLTKLATGDNLQQTAMARRAAMELGKTMIEMVCLLWYSDKKVHASLVKTSVNEDILQQAIDANLPIIFLTPHMSNFEVALRNMSTKTKRIFTVLYKPTKKAWINHLMLRGRTTDNIKPLPTTRSGILRFAKTIRDGGMIGLLPDSVASSSDGVWVDFFGQKVFATTLAAKLIINNPQAVTFIVATKRIKGGFHVEYIPVTAATADVKQVVQQIYQIIEQIVLMAPEQYYWSYDRFRTPPYSGMVS